MNRLNLRAKYREHWTVLLIVCAAVGLSIQMRGGAIVFVLFLGPCALIWLLFAFIQAIGKPTARPKLAANAALLVLTIGVVYGIFIFRIRTDQANAERLALAIVEYRQRVGTLPDVIADAGPTAKAMATRLDARYLPDADRPLLEYNDAWDLWRRHRYDFSAERWNVIISD